VLTIRKPIITNPVLEDPEKVAPEAGKSQPTKRLPTHRIKFSKQLDIIRAYGVKSQNGSKAANYKDVAEVVSIHFNTISLLVGFLVENGFLERNGDATMPTKPVLEFAQAHNWSPDTAPKKLAPIIRHAWFGELLLEKLAFRSMQEDEAIAELAGAISAGTEFKSQVATLVEYAITAGLVRRDGSVLSLGEGAEAPLSESAVSGRQEKSQQGPEQRDSAPLTARSSSASTSTSFMTTEGAVQFHVSIRVTMQEMAGWTPDRISAFFAGLAQVLAAKKGAEEIEN
jgi:hypothetical protein